MALAEIDEIQHHQHSSQSKSIASHSASDRQRIITSADFKLDQLLRLGIRLLILGISPDVYCKSPVWLIVSLWVFLFIFYFAYSAYQIVVAIFFARSLLETISSFYVATYLTAFACQWGYLYLIIPKFYSNRILLRDFQCALSCPGFTEKAVDEYSAFITKMTYIFGVWWGTNFLLHLFGPVVEAVLTVIRGERLENFVMLPQVFKFPVWGQALMYFSNAVTSGALWFFCVGANVAMAVDVAKIKIVCETLNEALENAADNRYIGQYVKDHVEIIRRAKELTKRMATMNVFVFCSGYLEFATQMFIVTVFDLNVSYYPALAYSMTSIFFLVAIPCFMGSQVTHSLESVADGSYFGQWYEKDKGLSRHVILMTQISQNKFEQTILFGSIKVERAAILNLLRSSYAAYTVLMIFQAK